MRRRSTTGICLMLVCLLCLSGCGFHFSEILPGSGLSSDVLMKADEEVLSTEEGSVWLWALKTACENDTSEEIWSVNLEEGTTEEVLKEAAREYIQEMFLAAQMAQADGLTVSGEVQTQIETAAAQYMTALSGDASSDAGLQDAVVQAYTRLYLARLSLSNALSASNVEITDDEARVVRVYQIILSFETDEEKTTQKKRADKIVSRVEKGTSTFAVQALEYSDADTIELTVVRDQLDRELETAVFALSDGEMSEVLETDDSYVIYYCVDDMMEEETEAHREELRTEKLEGLYQDALADYSEETDWKWNSSAWKGLSVTDEEAAAADFFGIYAETVSG
ncbi:MAG: peptidyl-prolyl cis-trans isomerase [Lachnospiraceae bacterium]|nr:peptidyl-prolyl cis-trans isomerase [Lachnospiraceae bacterium]